MLSLNVVVVNVV